MQGNSIFVYDVDTVHNLSVTFQVPGFLRSSPKVVHAAHLISEPSRRSEREGSVSMSENLNLFPDNLSGTHPCMLSHINALFIFRFVSLRSTCSHHGFLGDFYYFYENLLDLTE